MSFRVTLSPSKRAAGRFLESVRRALLKALTEEGITQSDVARTIGVGRSVIHRELRGHKDITLGRVAEIASAAGRKAEINLVKPAKPAGSNITDKALLLETNCDSDLKQNGVSMREAFL